MYLRPGDDRLRDELDAGLKEALTDGRLKEILAKYGLWNAAQEQLSNPEVQAKSQPQSQAPERPGNWAIVRRYLGPLLSAAGVTVLLSLIAMPLAMLLGLGVAVGRLYGPWP